MQFRNLFCLILVLCSINSQLLAAKVYKWKDENGKIHYSDKPPKDSKKQKVLKTVKVDLVNLSGQTEIPTVQRNSPIPYTSSNASKNIILEQVSIELSGQEFGENPVIGKAYRYTKSAEKIARNLYRNKAKNITPLTCLNDGKLRLNNASYILRKSDFRLPFSRVIDKNGYSTPSAHRKRFALQQNTQADLSLAAIIISVNLEHCGDENSTRLTEYSQNSSYVKIRWELFDNLRREVIYKTVTEGSDRSINKPPRKNGASTSLTLAFQYALENLLSNKDFVQHLSFKSNLLQQNQSQSNPKESIKVGYHEADNSSVFIDKVPKIKLATATIRTPSGHGSGFVISKKGYVLTNQHVIGQSRQVLVIIQGKVFDAEIIKSDPLRDVALLKIKEKFDHKPLNISYQETSIGQGIFVVGTPLDESLDFTVTQGILSAKRKNNGLSFYQTDAAVNPGNSGGPVFDQKGNVIAITVAGIFTHDGGSKNINYLIPIESAFKALSIEKL